jgi:hypothetical protein
MNRSAKTFLVLAVTVLGTGLLSDAEVHAGGGSSWGWKKPMNKRMGALYTSNRNANFSRSNQRKTSSHYGNSQRQNTYTQQHVRQSYAPQAYVPRQTTASQMPHQVVVNPAVVKNRQTLSQQTVPQTNSHRATSPNTGFWLGPAKPSPAATAPVAAPSPNRDVLPHKSTTSTFWH